MAEIFVGYAYKFGMQFGLCQGNADSITQIKVADRLLFDGLHEGGTLVINEPGLFGGLDGEGGVYGDLVMYSGLPTQPASPYLIQHLGPDIPAFRGLTTVILEDMVVGRNPRLPAWSFKVQRIDKRSDGSDQWLPDLAKLPISANPRLNDLRVRWDLFDVFYTTGNPADVDFFDPSTSSDPQKTVLFNPGDGQLHTIEFSVTSFVENRTYFGGSPVAGTTKVYLNGVAGPLTGWNVFRLVISDPPATYNLNNGVSSHSLVLVKDVFEVDIQDGATVTLEYLPIGGGLVGPHQWMVINMTDDINNMNPAHILRECLTDESFGLGFPELDIDDTSFEDAARTLFDEGLGLSYFAEDEITTHEFIKLIIKHINAAYYPDQTTGKFTLKLIRDDYNEASIPTLGESQIKNITEYSRNDPEDGFNSVTVVYWDSRLGKNSSITVDNIALIEKTGHVNNTTINYPAFTNWEVASKAASRDLKTLTSPLLNATIEVNRTASNLNIGDVFKFEYPDYHEGYVVMRITKIDFGDGIKNRVKITATEDIFSFPDIAIVNADENEWEDNLQEPEVPQLRYFDEIPYYTLVQNLGQTIIDDQLTTDPTQGYVYSAFGPEPGVISARSWINSGAGYEEGALLHPFPHGQLSADLIGVETSFTLVNFKNLDRVNLGTLGIINNQEFIRIDSIDPVTGDVTCGRGVLDSTPPPATLNDGRWKNVHPVGTNVFFLENATGSDNQIYLDSEIIFNKILTRSGLGYLDLANAIEDDVTMGSRAIRPYPPGRFFINGTLYNTVIAGDASLSLQWFHRDRTQQTSPTLDDFLASHIGPEVGTEYTIRIYGENDTLGHTHTAVPGLNYDNYLYSQISETADFTIPKDPVPFFETGLLDDLGAVMGAGGAKWATLVEAPNGKIYGIPWSSPTILIIDPATGTATRDNMGAFLAGSGKYSGGVLAPNGKIYAVPWDSSQMLIIDPVAGTATETFVLSGPSKWQGCVLGADGFIYGIPRDATTILKIDPSTDTFVMSNMGASLTGADKWGGGALGADGKIYGIPSTAADILIIDTTLGTATRSNMGLPMAGSAKWFNGVAASNGKIYGIPRFEGNVLIIDPVGGTATSSTMGASFAGNSEWAGGVEVNGVIYCSPWLSADILRIDVATETATRVTMGVVPDEAGDWWDGTQSSVDNKIYYAPFNNGDILILDVVPPAVSYRPNGRLRIELESVTTHNSHQTHSVGVIRTGFGYNFGTYFG